MPVCAHGYLAPRRPRAHPFPDRVIASRLDSAVRRGGRRELVCARRADCGDVAAPERRSAVGGACAGSGAGGGCIGRRRGTECGHGGGVRVIMDVRAIHSRAIRLAQSSARCLSVHVCKCSGPSRHGDSKTPAQRVCCPPLAFATQFTEVATHHQLKHDRFNRATGQELIVHFDFINHAHIYHTCTIGNPAHLCRRNPTVSALAHAMSSATTPLSDGEGGAYDIRPGGRIKL